MTAVAADTLLFGCSSCVVVQASLVKSMGLPVESYSMAHNALIVQGSCFETRCVRVWCCDMVICWSKQSWIASHGLLLRGTLLRELSESVSARDVSLWHMKWTVVCFSWGPRICPPLGTWMWLLYSTSFGSMVILAVWLWFVHQWLRCCSAGRTSSKRGSM